MSKCAGGSEVVSSVVIMVKLVNGLVNMLAFFHTCVLWFCTKQ